jgi:dihydroorotase
MKYDLLLKGGCVIDPSQGIHQVIMDVGIKGERIEDVGQELDVNESVKVMDLGGNLVCPGLVDLHGHWYEGSIYGIDPNMSLNRGVTTVVDAGTSGFINFPYFRKHTIDHAQVRVLAFLHISCLGLHAPFAEELRDLRYARPKETAVVIEKNRDVAVGVKIRIGSPTENHGIAALAKALEAANQAAVPLMVHISRGANVPEIMKRLRPGDILTHCFQGRGDGILEPASGSLLPLVGEAGKRGVLFDVGHGCGSFSWETARRAFELGFYPDTISTDLHRYCVEDPFHVDLLNTMSKFLALGMTLEEVVLKCTYNPAKAIHREGEIGMLRKGAAADVMVFEVEQGEFEFSDTHFQVLRGEKKLKTAQVIRLGKAWEPASYPAILRDLYDSDYEVIRAVREQA